MHAIAIFFLATLAAGGIAWVFIYPILSGERKTEKRVASITQAEQARAGRGQQRSRRDDIEATLKQLDESHKKTKRIPLSVRISQAGLTWSKQQFMLVSAGAGVALFLAGLLTGAGPIAAVALAFVGVLGFPRWLLSYLKKRREKQFLEAFPDAIDIIVRGAKAGLPLLDCLKVISVESPEPVRSEFRSMLETQAIGIPLAEAAPKMYEKVPVPEANFFGIIVSIQQRSGGNLAEVLGNLSRVVRERKKMKAKIRALSQEAKASAAIIGSLPVVVMILVYITSPGYISMLWTESAGRVMLTIAIFWMALGVLVMKKMINFDF
ncbi:MAG: type II secretion system F family protein [Pseudolabrys sp.]|jgi:tight adherence protein B